MQAQQQVATVKAGHIAYRDVGGGLPLVFFHGIFANGRLWDPVVSLLQDECRCIVPDWPLGSHSDPFDASADLSPAGLARLAVEFFDQIGLDKVVLVGNDTGGAICQIIAADNPDRVEAMVLTPCDAYENFPPRLLFVPLNLGARVPGGLRFLAEIMRFRVGARLPLSLSSLAKKPIAPDVVDAWFGPARRDVFIRRDTKRVIRSVSKRYTLKAIDKLRKSAPPTLLAWAPEAPFFEFKYAERLAEDLPYSKLVAIPDAFTFVSLDQPGATATAIRDFLKNLPSQPA